jgi:hypothetical protein
MRLPETEKKFKGKTIREMGAELRKSRSAI